LESTASFAGGYATARQYLTSGQSGTWKPAGWAADVTGPLTVQQISFPQVQSGVSGTAAIVSVTGQQMATVNSEGHYQSSQPGTQYTWDAVLQRVQGQWRITNPPASPPLYASSFQRVYLSRNLYYLAPSSDFAVNQALVPDPIFVPLQATSVDVADTLVNSLLQDPQGWLAGGAVTAVPAEASLLGGVAINAGTATVDLGVLSSPSPAVLRQILAQLVWTLASSSFGQPALAQSVELEINGHPRLMASWSGGQPQQGGQALVTVPQMAGGQPMYSLASHNVVQKLAISSSFSSSRVSVAARIPVQTGAGDPQLSSIAVSPGGRYVAGIAQSGHAIYYGQLKPGAKLTEYTQSAPFASLSWDSNGNLWAVGTGAVALIHPGRPTYSLGSLPSSGSILQMQVAPDGARAALIFHGPQGNQLFLYGLEFTGLTSTITGAALGKGGLVIGTDVHNPTQLAWYDSNDLVVLSQPSAASVLQEVPVNGGGSTDLIPPGQGAQSLSSAGPLNPLAAGLPQGGLALTNTLDGTWIPYPNVGQSPTYPAPTNP
ncbi:MAG: LpqB family beta-propeller domain-containing protein, partial [Streptosporangiaceae bacterium]